MHANTFGGGCYLNHRGRQTDTPNRPAALTHFARMMPPQPTCRSTQNNADGSSAGSLVLRLVGLARTRIVRSSSNKNSSGTTYQARDEFLSFDIQLASFGGRAAASSHSFPFSVMLPPGLPSSMKVRRDHSKVLECGFVRAAPLDEELRDILGYCLARNTGLAMYVPVCAGFPSHAR